MAVYNKFALLGMCLSWMFPASVSGEDVKVHILRRMETETCSLPARLDVTVLRHQNQDVVLSLTTNHIATFPSHVVLMSSHEASGEIQYQHVKIPGGHQAYHSVEHGASFVVRCSRHEATNTPFFVLDGTFFHEDSKFKLKPMGNDVIVGPIDVTAAYIMTEVQEYDQPQDHKFIERLDLNLPTLRREQATQSEETSESHRSKRDTTNYYIDVLPVIDYFLYSRWLSENNGNELNTAEAINSYMTNVFTAMSLRIGTLSLGNGIVLNLRMMNPHLSKTASASPYSEDHKEPGDPNGLERINVEMQLKAFRNWTLKTTGLPDSDHTMLFTGYDVYGGLDGEVGNNLTRGLAFVGQICDKDGYSSSVVQDQMGYQSEPVAVHELGHSLGSHHDGHDNDCDTLDQYIMANGTYTKTKETLFNQFAFSTCSSHEISTNIVSLEGTDAKASCLADTKGKELLTVVPLHGLDQCQALFGENSYVCRGGSFPEIQDVCTALYCAIPGEGYCRKLIPATGTCCGNGKYCIEGICETAPSGECVLDETCPFDDQPGIVAMGKTCSQLDHYLCYQQVIYDRCCKTCQSYRTDISACYFGDKTPGCEKSNCGTTLSNAIKYDFYCCESCNHVGCQDKPGIIFQGVTYDCPSFLSTKGKHFCYFQAIHNAYCCKTCEDHRSSDDSCAYGDMLHEYNCPAILNLGRACTELEKTKCCVTCASITITAAPPVGGGDPTTDDSSIGNGITTQKCTGFGCSRASSTLTVSHFSFIGCQIFIFLISAVFYDLLLR